MEKLSTIQKHNNLNEVFHVGDRGPGDAYHEYVVRTAGVVVSGDILEHALLANIQFQKGARNDPDAIHGVLDSDLLEIVRDRLQAFQKGPYATRENACALTHIEEALMWMNKRAEDRAERGVLGTYQK